MEQFNRTALKQLREDLNKALEEVAAQHNIIVDVGNASFTSDTATFKLNLIIKGEGVENREDARVAKYEKDFNTYHNMFGIDKDVLGKTFKDRTKQFTILGLDTKKRKYPIIAKDQNGKQFKLSSEQLSRMKQL